MKTLNGFEIVDAKAREDIGNIVVPTKVSELENDEGYLTEHQSLDDYVTKTELEGKGYLTEHQSLDEYVTRDELTGEVDKIATPTITPEKDHYEEVLVGSVDALMCVDLANGTYIIGDSANAINYKGWDGTSCWLKDFELHAGDKITLSESAIELELHTSNGVAYHSYTREGWNHIGFPKDPVFEINPDTKYATEQYVNDAVANIDVSGGQGSSEQTVGTEFGHLSPFSTYSSYINLSTVTEGTFKFYSDEGSVEYIKYADDDNAFIKVLIRNGDKITLDEDTIVITKYDAGNYDVYSYDRGLLVPFEPFEPQLRVNSDGVYSNGVLAGSGGSSGPAKDWQWVEESNFSSIVPVPSTQYKVVVRIDPNNDGNTITTFFELISPNNDPGMTINETYRLPSCIDGYYFYIEGGVIQLTDGTSYINVESIGYYYWG